MADTAVIKSFANGGEAVGTLQNGKSVFVRGAIPGEKVELKIVQEKKRFARAKLLNVIEKSSVRITPECPHFENCPGCSYQHVPYETELEWKQKQLQWLLRSFEAENFEPPVPSPERYNWRNKIVLHRENGACGYRAEDNLSIIPVTECKIALPEINQMIPECRNFSGKDVVLRKSVCDSVCMFEKNNSCGILTEDIPGFGKFQVDSCGFFQTNIQVAALLVKKVVEILKKQNCRELCELYCGTGIFSITAAENIPDLKSSACEISAQAVKTADQNAAIHKVSGSCRFTASDAGKFFAKFHAKTGNYTLLVDPPRTGMDDNMRKNIRKHQPDSIIYISCAADTLARDINSLYDLYKIKSISLFDMFPATSHYETIAVLEKRV